ncbi:MAG: [Fe-Fe] hydrogenase large subunit C-terminal domain-containing protein, partial [Candidatus Paceibacterota bacterium]
MKITIDGKEIEAVEGQSVLEAAKAAGIEIPALCYHPDLCVKANCRLCLVEVEGIPVPQTACSTKVKEGMKVKTGGEAIMALRKTNIELILGEHRRNCPQCIWQGKCPLLKYAVQLKANLAANPLRKPEPDVCKFGPIILDRSKCIECRNCVDMCARQTGSRRGTDKDMKSDGFLEIEGRGKDIKIKPSCDPKKDCIYCGQCIMHCPVGALDAESPVDELDALLKDRKGKTLVIQFAPSIRSSIGEMFGIEYGKNITGELVAGMRKLGFDKVFDTTMAADLTTVEEAKELVWRVTEKKPLPMFTSCCPGWMRYLE